MRVVKFFKDKSFVWGGDWDKEYKDYQHFQKELPAEYKAKYAIELERVLKNLQ